MSRGRFKDIVTFPRHIPGLDLKVKLPFECLDIDKDYGRSGPVTTRQMTPEEQRKYGEYILPKNRHITKSAVIYQIRYGRSLQHAARICKVTPWFLLQEADRHGLYVPDEWIEAYQETQKDGVDVKIKFTVLGEPVAQARPKFARMGNHVKAYDPEKSRSYKSLVRDEAAKVMPDKPLDGPLKVYVLAHRSIPKSWSKKKQTLALDGDLRPTTRPDIDNVVKGIKDALKGVIWRDDSQVVSIIAEKWYSENPRVEVTVVSA